MKSRSFKNFENMRVFNRMYHIGTHLSRSPRQLLSRIVRTLRRPSRNTKANSLAYMGNIQQYLQFINFFMIRQSKKRTI